MSNELPHAVLVCTECGTTFRVTLKKGRVPSKPVPCPKCKNPIAISESDIVQPGAKAAAQALGGDLRQTKPGDELRKTKLVQVDEASVAAMMGQPTSEVPADPPTSEVPADPPTAEVPTDPPTSEVPTASESEEPPAFGITHRKKIRGGRKSTSDPLATAREPGVHVVKGSGRGARDNVFGGRTAASSAIGRIATKQIRVTRTSPSFDPNDPDLPVPTSDHAAVTDYASSLPTPSDEAGTAEPERLVLHDLEPPPAAEIEPEPQDEAGAAPESEPDDEPEAVAEPAPPPKPKLDLSRLRKVMKRLEAESEAREEAASEPQVEEEFDLDLKFDEIVSEASDAIDASALQAFSEVEESDAEESEDELSAPSEEPESEPSSEPDEDDERVVVDDLDDLVQEAKQSAAPTAEEPSDAYELGEAEIPEGAPAPPTPRGRADVIAGIVLLLVIVVLAYVFMQ